MVGIFEQLFRQLIVRSFFQPFTRFQFQYLELVILETQNLSHLISYAWNLDLKSSQTFQSLVLALEYSNSWFSIFQSSRLIGQIISESAHWSLEFVVNFPATELIRPLALIWVENFKNCLKSVMNRTSAVKVLPQKVLLRLF